MQRDTAISILERIRDNCWIVPLDVRTVIERALNNEALKGGERVRHKKFGDGTVGKKSRRKDHVHVKFDADIKGYTRIVQLHTVERI